MLSMVVLASVYFIWQYVFVKNATKSNAGYCKTCYRGSNNCDDDEYCFFTKGQGGMYGCCEPKVNKGFGVVNYKCNCATEFGPCSDKWGQTNIKSRECKIDIFNGTEGCNYYGGGKLYQWVSCI